MAEPSSDLGTVAGVARTRAPLVVNGAPRPVADGTALPALLEELGLRVGTVVVEHNGVALTRAEARAAVLRGGDTLEIIRAVAGG
jgi:sulfur carrier protein